MNPTIRRVTVKISGETLLVECRMPFENDVRIKVWAPVHRHSLYCGGHFLSTCGQTYKLVGTDPRWERYTHLPKQSKERGLALQAAYKERFDLAHQAITAAFKIGPTLDIKDPDHQSWKPYFTDGEWRGNFLPEVVKGMACEEIEENE